MVDRWENFWEYLTDLSAAGWAGIQAILDGDLSFSKLKEQFEQGMQSPSITVKEAMTDMWREVSGRDYVGETVSAVVSVKNEIVSLAGESVNTADGLHEIVVTAKRISPVLDTTGNAAATAEAKLAALAASKDKMDPFAEALVHTAERVDAAFSDAWRGAFDSFEDFAGSLKDAFLNLLAELAHLAITRPIVVAITGALGLGGTAGSLGAGASGAGGLGSIFSGVGGLGGGINKLLTMGAANPLFGTGAGNFFFQSASGLNQTGGLIGGGVGAGSLLTGGAGLFGSLIANSLFGGGVGTSIGSGLGGLGGGLLGSAAAGGGLLAGSLGTLGAFAGPVGALLGAVLGGGLGS
jgi:hypothetical protein